MNIIFGDSVDSIPNHYTVLELDTFRPADSNKTMTAYCLVEKLALDEFVTLEHYKQIHADVSDVVVDKVFVFNAVFATIAAPTGPPQFGRTLRPLPVRGRGGFRARGAVAFQCWPSCRKWRSCHSEMPPDRRCTRSSKWACGCLHCIWQNWR